MRDEADALELARHDYAHVLAEAVQNLFPGTQITFGPATDDGFYYDFAPTAERGPFTEEDLPVIEEEMRRIIAKDEKLVREVWTREQVRQFFIDQGEAFKAEWVMELPEGEPITVYRTGEGEGAWLALLALIAGSLWRVAGLGLHPIAAKMLDHRISSISYIRTSSAAQVIRHFFVVVEDRSRSSDFSTHITNGCLTRTAYTVSSISKILHYCTCTTLYC